jgi:hypothetical protein
MRTNLHEFESDHELHELKWISRIIDQYAMTLKSQLASTRIIIRDNSFLFVKIRVRLINSCNSF